MYLYNSLSHKKELFVPNNPDIVKMYTCGPTVYHYAHIGNLRTYIMEDVLEKALRYVGYNVKRVMNITDVGHLASDADTGEDKMVKGAKRENKSVMEIAKYYTDAFFADCEKLNIKRPDVIEPATNCIDEYIEMVQKLLDTGNVGVYHAATTRRVFNLILGTVWENRIFVVRGLGRAVTLDSRKRRDNDIGLLGNVLSVLSVIQEYRYTVPQLPSEIVVVAKIYTRALVGKRGDKSCAGVRCVGVGMWRLNSNLLLATDAC